MNWIKPGIIYSLIFSISFLSTGCNIIEFFKSDKKEVKRTIDKIKVAINKNDWTTIKAKSSNDFKWTTSDGKTYSNKSLKDKIKPLGMDRFRASFDDLPDARISFMMEIDEVKKIANGKYVTKISSRMKIRKGAGNTDNIKWQSLYTWIKKGTEWYFNEVKDLNVKQGNGKFSYNTNPVIKPKSKKKSRRK